MNEFISIMSALFDSLREFLVTPSGWKVYLCDLFSGRWKVTLGGVLWLSKHGNYSSAVSPRDTTCFQSDRWCFWDVRESSFPLLHWTCVCQIFFGSIKPIRLLYLLLVRKEIKIQSIYVENIASTKGLKGEDMFINFVSISFTIYLDSWGFYELLFETCKRWLGWH